MICFSHCNDVECPECPPQGRRNRKPLLQCCDQNYSGCGVDIGKCSECGKGFQVSYKVDEVVRADAWDGPSRVQREAEEAQEREQNKASVERIERSELARLKAKYHD